MPNKCFDCGKEVEVGYHCRPCWEKWSREAVKEDACEAHMAANKKLYYGEGWR